MKIPEKTLYLVIIVLLIAVGTFGWLWDSAKETIIEKDGLITALNDTIVVYKNEKGENVAKISQLQTAKTKDFLKIKSKDATIQKLQTAVKDNKERLGSSGSVTVFTTNTNVIASVPTAIITPRDTVTKNDTTFIYPEYKSNITLGKWVKADIKANKDSVGLKLGVLNEYTLVIGEEKVEKTGFLGIGAKTRFFSEVTNHNPYSTTPTLRTYSVKSTIKPKRLSLGVQGGYNILGKPYVGVGLQYNILNIF